MIRFIDVHRDQFGVEAFCRVLSATDCGFLTSRSYRAATQRPSSARALRDEVLIGEIRRIHAENYGVYAYRKMHQAMRRAGWDIGRDQTARLMKVGGLEGVRRGRKALTTTPSGVSDRRPDLVERDFTALGPNQLRPEVRSRIVAAQERFDDIDDRTSTAELDGLAAELAGIAEDVLPEAPKVTGEQSRLVLTLAERDQNKVQRAFMRRLSGGEQDR
ncbi:IS3 family transposase [Brachybacterium tyrofermentans]|uniref:IS3 family transposase n=1 Tax=Brachybacterium tyrofermentans TaxID=47848 RepID=UPI003FCFBC59